MDLFFKKNKQRFSIHKKFLLKTGSKKAIISHNDNKRTQIELDILKD